MKDRIKALRTEIATLTNQAKTMYAALEKAGDQAKAEDAETFNTLIADGIKKREELDRLEALDSLDELSNQPQDRKTHDRPQAPQGRKTWGQTVIESEQYKAARANWTEGKMERARVPSRKAIYGSADATGGYAVVTQREPEIIDIARQRPRSILTLINQADTESDAIEYVEMNSRTNNAAVVPEFTGGNFGLKPESDLALNMRTAAVKTIATWIAASRQILADAPRLRDMIDNELAYMVEITLENQILTGDGTGSNFTGMLNWSGIQSRVHAVSGRDFNAADTRADTLRRAITDIRLAFYEATGVVLYPGDAEMIELTKDTTGQYVNVYDPVAMRVWRVPVVETPAMTDGTALVGNFRLGATLWDRQQTDVRVGEPNDFFLRNAVAILAELRAAFAVTRPLAIEKVTGL